MNNGARSDIVKTKAKFGICCVFSPLNLSLIGLAVAVTLWGFAYKLSLYHPHEVHSSRSFVAKMWLGSEAASATVKKRAQRCSYPRTTLETMPKRQARTRLTSSNGLRTLSECVCSARDCLSICTPRPPPSHARQMIVLWHSPWSWTARCSPV